MSTGGSEDVERWSDVEQRYEEKYACSNGQGVQGLGAEVENDFNKLINVQV